MSEKTPPNHQKQQRRAPQARRQRSRKSQRKGQQPLIVWGGALALSAVILLGSYYLSQAKRKSAEVPVSPRESVKTVASMPDVQKEEPPQVVGEQTEEEMSEPQGGEVQISDETGKVTLDLSRIAGEVELSVPVLWPENQRLPLNYSCYREHATPPMSWQNAPSGTRSYAVFMERIDEGADPVLYWGVYNISSGHSGLEKELGKGPVLDDGVTFGQNDHGVTQYTGPCEPKGMKNYRFRVFALDADLGLEPGLEKDELIRKMNGHIIDMAEQKAIHYLRK